jgi:rhamnose transport system permease protein
MTNQNATLIGGTPGRTIPAFGHPLWRRILVNREAAVILAAVLVYVVSCFVVPYFTGTLTIDYLLLDATPILLIALPMTLVIITGEIDLSVASTLGLSNVLLGILTQAKVPIILAMIICLVVGLLAGAINGFLITVVGLPSLAVTIGTLALFRGVAVGLLGTTAITSFPQYWLDLSQAEFGQSGIPEVMVLVVILIIVFGIVLHFTPFGRGLFAIGLSKEAAAFSGVKVGRSKFYTYLLTGVVSALAGIFWTFRYGTSQGDNATGLELSVIAAVLLGGVSIFGGKGALPGVIGGVLLIGVLNSALQLASVSSSVINIITGALLVISVLYPRILAFIARRRASATNASK